VGPGVQRLLVSFSCQKAVGSERERKSGFSNTREQLTLNRECFVGGSFNEDSLGGGRTLGDHRRAAESGDGEPSRPLSRLEVTSGGEAALEGAV
jgi:hypothetical protein